MRNAMSGQLTTEEITLLVIAKEPLPGKAKTRLIPALGPEGSARVAEAALADTLAAVAACGGTDRRRVICLEGNARPWLPDGFEVIPQRGSGLAQRLANGFDDTGGAILLVGMDTPQITPELLEQCCAELCTDGTDAVLGLAEDGGWWTMGLRSPDRRIFEGVPMSEDDTGARQIEAIERLGLRHRALPVISDVDTIEEAREVAAQSPASRFAMALVAAEAATETPA